MPIDYLSKYNQEEQALKNLLASRKQGIGDELNKTRSRIQTGRQNLLGNALSGAVGSLGIAGVPSAPINTTSIRRNLDQTLNQNLAKTGYNNQRSRLSLVYDNALRLAEDFGYGRRQAEAFARQYAMDEQRRKSEASQNSINLDNARRMEGLREMYAQKGMDLENSYASGGSDYNAALLRVLAGTGAQIGTAYALNKSSSASGGSKPSTSNATLYDRAYRTDYNV